MDDTSSKNAGNTANMLASIQKIASRGPAPVHLWNPPFCGDMDMEIRADGTWFHEGTPIGRPAMVKLFASVLKKEDGKFFLVTPVEKLGIRVEDAPFIAIDVEISDQDGEGKLVFTTNLDEEVTAGPEHPIRVEIDTDGTPRPYLHVRSGLEALIDRKNFYRLAENARPDNEGRMSVRSNGAVFPLEA